MRKRNFLGFVNYKDVVFMEHLLDSIIGFLFYSYFLLWVFFSFKDFSILLIQVLDWLWPDFANTIYCCFS